MKKVIKKYQAGAAAAGAGAASGTSGLGKLLGKGGGMEGMDIGGMASSLGHSIAMLINANKKQDPTGRPYKKGTNMIKYQTGIKSLTKKEGKVGKGSEYFAQAKKLSAQEKAAFRKLDAEAKEKGMTFEFKGLKYDPTNPVNLSSPPKSNVGITYSPKPTQIKSAKSVSKSDNVKPLVKMKEDVNLPENKPTKTIYKSDTIIKNKLTEPKKDTTLNIKYKGKMLPEVIIESPKKLSISDIMAKKKQLLDLRSKVPGFGPFRRSEDAKTIEKIDYISSKLYTLSQQQAAYERRKKRGEASKQAEIDAQERAKEFNRLTKDLKI